jgi:hypothetical protein
VHVKCLSQQFVRAIVLTTLLLPWQSISQAQAPSTITSQPSAHTSGANLLEARMIVTTYNQHVRLLSSEPFGWFAPPKFTRAWEPTLLWNRFTY